MLNVCSIRILSLGFFEIMYSQLWNYLLFFNKIYIVAYAQYYYQLIVFKIRPDIKVQQKNIPC